MRFPLLAGLLAASGLLPFLAGALHVHGLAPDWAMLGLENGRALLLGYGKVILSFMAGVLWGFAARAEAPVHLALSVLPALWAVFIAGNNLLLLAIGFAAILLLDGWAVRGGSAPEWWMRLRLPVTGVAVLCLIAGGF